VVVVVEVVVVGVVLVLVLVLVLVGVVVVVVVVVVVLVCGVCVCMSGVPWNQNWIRRQRAGSCWLRQRHRGVGVLDLDGVGALGGRVNKQGKVKEAIRRR